MRWVPERSLRPEIMDRPGNPTRELVDALRDIRLTNRWLGGRRAMFTALRPYLLRATGPLELLDVGTGAADLPLAIVRYAAALDRELRVTAIDLDPDTTAIAARAACRCDGVRVLRADARRLPFEDGAFDLVSASMFLHHFEHREVVQLLRGFRRVARCAVVINDLRRHLVPWAFIQLVSRLTARSRMYVHDAPLSVLRGFTPRELALAARQAGVRAEPRRHWPYRLTLTIPAGEQP